MKIVGRTVGTTIPKPNWSQNDPSKGDYIFNKPENVVNTHYIDSESYSIKFDWDEVLGWVKAGQHVIIRIAVDSSVTQYYHLVKTYQYDSESEIDMLAFSNEGADFVGTIELHSSGDSSHSNTTISHVRVDKTLSFDGMAADAKVVGDKLGDIETALDSILAMQAELIGGDAV